MEGDFSLTFLLSKHRLLLSLNGPFPLARVRLLHYHFCLSYSVLKHQKDEAIWLSYLYIGLLRLFCLFSSWLLLRAKY